jgi:Ca2+-binding EF-hand superfamily protein
MKSIRPRILTFTFAALLSAASASAVAQSMTEATPGSAAGAPSFKSYDSNGDGKISLEEFKAQGGQEQAFARIDANQDKSLNKDEFSRQDKPSSKPY